MLKPIIVVIAVTFACGCARKDGEQADFASPTHQGRATPRFARSINPKSSEAAELLVGAFVKLINQGQLGDAYMLLGPSAPPKSQFEADFRRYSNLIVSPGRPGEQEGAAGSIYLSVPLDVSGKLRGQWIKRRATAVVRRINDVPGSTEQERHWHIERIDWDTD